LFRVWLGEPFLGLVHPTGGYPLGGEGPRLRAFFSPLRVPFVSPVSWGVESTGGTLSVSFHLFFQTVNFCSFPRKNFSSRRFSPSSKEEEVGFSRLHFEGSCGWAPLLFCLTPIYILFFHFGSKDFEGRTNVSACFFLSRPRLLFRGGGITGGLIPFPFVGAKWPWLFSRVPF